MKRSLTFALLVTLACCASLRSSGLGLSTGEEVPLLHSKLEDLSKDLGQGNFDDIGMEERYVFKDQDDLLEYIRELQRRYSLLVGRPRCFLHADGIDDDDEALEPLRLRVGEVKH